MGNSNSKHLSWDEQAIEEHDKLRGTRMKIIEAETPYEHNIEIDEEEEEEEENQTEKEVKNKESKHINNNNVPLCWDTLETRLNDVAAGADDEKQKLKKKDEFKKHRSNHYNEFQMVQKYRMEHANDDDDDDEEDE